MRRRARIKRPLASLCYRDQSHSQLIARLSDPADRRIAEDAKQEEADHAVILRGLAGGVRSGKQLRGVDLCRARGWCRRQRQQQRPQAQVPARSHRS